MASTWPPPVAGWEFVPDFDGTVVRFNTSVLDSNTVKQLNDYNPAGIVSQSSNISSLSWYFPQLRDITALSCSYNTQGGTYMLFQSSVDTIDGIAGAWTTLKNHAELAAAGFTSQTNNVLRKPLAVSQNGVRSVRLYYSSNNDWHYHYGMHVWGTYTPTAQLHIYHPTLDQPLTSAGTDHGDLVRGAISDKQFRVKNTHATQTANSVGVSIQSPDYAGAAAGSTLVYASISASSHNIGNLAPGAFSGVFTMRRTMSTGALYGDKGTTRVTAVAGTWT